MKASRPDILDPVESLWDGFVLSLVTDKMRNNCEIKSYESKSHLRSSLKGSLFAVLVRTASSNKASNLASTISKGTQNSKMPNYFFLPSSLKTSYIPKMLVGSGVLSFSSLHRQALI